MFSLLSTFNFFQFLLLCLILFCEPDHLLSGPVTTANNKVLIELAAEALQGCTSTQGKASIDGKFKSSQREPFPEQEGARTANLCKGAPDGDYMDAQNPYGYITCLGGQTYRKNCAPGLMWDNNKKSCVRQFK